MKILIICGPTGSGKSALGLKIAETFNGEIVSCDSVQIYRGFDIGSAKPTQDEQNRIPHHMIDIVNWSQDFDAGQYAVMARAAATQIRERGKLPIVVGGSGLYLRAFLGEGWHADLPKNDDLRKKLNEKTVDELRDTLEKLDPIRAKEIHPNDKFRLARALELLTLLGKPVREVERKGELPECLNDPYIIFLDPPRKYLHETILNRTKSMLATGLVEEVRSLLAEGCPWNAKPMQTIGYKETFRFLRGEFETSQLEELILFATRQYAKRQMTWFKKVNVSERIPYEASMDSAVMKRLSLLKS